MYRPLPKTRTVSVFQPSRLFSPHRTSPEMPSQQTLACKNRLFDHSHLGKDPNFPRLDLNQVKKKMLQSYDCLRRLAFDTRRMFTLVGLLYGAATVHKKWPPLVGIIFACSGKDRRWPASMFLEGLSVVGFPSRWNESHKQATQLNSVRFPMSNWVLP